MALKPRTSAATTKTSAAAKPATKPIVRPVIRPAARPAVRPAAKAAKAAEAEVDFGMPGDEEFSVAGGGEAVEGPVFDEPAEEMPVATQGSKGKKQEHKGKAKVKEPRLKPRMAPKVVSAGNIEIASFDDSRYQSLQTKKAKQVRSKLTSGNEETVQKSLDVIFQTVMNDCAKKHGDGRVFTGSQTAGMLVGIPTPSLAFEWVTGNDVFLLSIIVQLVATPGVGKSGLLAEIIRWFSNWRGGGFLKENETKFNPLWYRSILGDRAFNRLQIDRCNSVEDWQRHLTMSMSSVKRSMIGTKEEPGCGKTIPIVWGVDSVMGKLSEEKIETILGKLDKQGLRGAGDFCAARGFPLEALIISSYLKAFPEELADWPFSLVLVNHLKFGQDDGGNTVRKKSGGEQISFQESLEIQLDKHGGPKKMIRCAEFEGYPVMLSSHKSSLAPGNRRALTRLLWRFETDPETGRQTQHTWWDWDWSTVWLLNDLMHGQHAHPLIKAKLNEIGFHLDCPSSADLEHKAWSRTLGMKKKEEAVPWNVLGKMIREDVDLYDQIKNALCLARRPIFQGAFDDIKAQLAKGVR